MHREERYLITVDRHEGTLARVDKLGSAGELESLPVDQVIFQLTETSSRANRPPRPEAWPGTPNQAHQRPEAWPGAPNQAS